MRKHLTATAASIALAFAAPATAATLLVDGAGELIGATGVTVNGIAYDVTFVDGTCVSVFNGCDAAGDFTFTNSADATAAATALLDQVLIDSGQGQFDSNFVLTFGCEANVFNDCTALIPYAGGEAFSAAGARNRNVLDSTIALVANASQFSTGSDFVWATFSPSSAVPEPSTWAMMLLGFGAAGFAMRRNRKFLPQPA